MSAQNRKTPDEPATVRLQPVRTLTDDSSWFDIWPSFSPDGQEVVFTRAPVRGDRRARLWQVSLSGGVPHSLTPADFERDCTRPDWSPDGKTIAFRAAGRSRSQGRGNAFLYDTPGAIWLLTVATGAMKPLTNYRQNDDYYPHWSSDGHWLYISRQSIQGPSNMDIWRIDFRGKEERITSHPTYDVYGVPSPDGKQLSFTSDRDGTRNVWVIDMNKGEKDATQFTFSGGRGATWSPDGRWIAFHPPPLTGHRGPSGGGIYIKRVTGGPTIQVTKSTDDTFHDSPHWSPDGRYILFDELDPNPETASTGHLKIVDVTKIVRR